MNIALGKDTRSLLHEHNLCRAQSLLTNSTTMTHEDVIGALNDLCMSLLLSDRANLRHFLEEALVVAEELAKD